MSTTGSFYRRLKANYLRRESEWKMKDYHQDYQAKAYTWGVLAAVFTIAVIVFYFMELNAYAYSVLEIVLSLTGTIVVVVATTYWYLYLGSRTADRRCGEYNPFKTSMWRFCLASTILLVVIIIVLANIDNSAIARLEAMRGSFGALVAYGVMATVIAPLLGMAIYPEDVKV